MENLQELKLTELSNSEKVEINGGALFTAIAVVAAIVFIFRPQPSPNTGPITPMII